MPSSCFWVPTCYVTTAKLNYSRHSGEPAESLKQAPIKIRNKPWMFSLLSFSSPVERGGFPIAILQGASECTLRGLVSLVPSVF